MSLKLLIENPTFDLDYVIEEKSKKDPQTLFIKGPFLMAEEKNKNGRIYPLNEMQNEVTRYTTEMVDTNRALGELSHPSSTDVNPERSCHIIKELHQEGNIFYGKSKILNTPVGNIVKSLIMEGVQLGVSSRALGKLTQTVTGNTVSNMHLICCDVVHDPSVPTAFVDGILESKEWIINADGTIAEDMEQAFNTLDRKLSNMPVTNSDDYLRGLIIGFLKDVK